MKEKLKLFLAWVNANVWIPSKPWLEYSGASVTLIVNPCHWRLLPWLKTDDTRSIWDSGPDYRGVTFGWLFLIVRVWLDNETW